MNTKLKEAIELRNLIWDATEEEQFKYFDYLHNRIRDLDLQLRTIKNCCENTKQRNREDK